MCGVSVDDEIHRPACVVRSRWQKSMNTAAVVLPSPAMNRKAPPEVTVESMFTENRAPVCSTTGVSPAGAQVVPEW